MRLRILSALVLILGLAACSTTNVEQALDVRVAVTNPRFGDNDPHEWKGKSPWHYAVHGIDVSKYQGAINWDQARAAGIAFAFIKATEGGDRVDDLFHQHWAGAARAGIPRGAYHFFYFCRPAFEQAAWFKKHVPVQRSALPPVLDMEWNHKSPSCTFRPAPDAVRKEMEVFIGIVGRHYGKTPIVYTTVGFYAENQLWLVKGVQFWLRSVAGHPSEKYSGQSWTFWQYTGTGQVPGVKGDTDINAFNGSTGDWKNWLGKNAR